MTISQMDKVERRNNRLRGVYSNLKFDAKTMKITADMNKEIDSCIKNMSDRMTMLDVQFIMRQYPHIEYTGSYPGFRTFNTDTFPPELIKVLYRYFALKK